MGRYKCALILIFSFYLFVSANREKATRLRTSLACPNFPSICQKVCIQLAFATGFCTDEECVCVPTVEMMRSLKQKQQIADSNDKELPVCSREKHVNDLHAQIDTTIFLRHMTNVNKESPLQILNSIFKNSYFKKLQASTDKEKPEDVRGRSDTPPDLEENVPDSGELNIPTSKNVFSYRGNGHIFGYVESSPSLFYTSEGQMFNNYIPNVPSANPASTYEMIKILAATRIIGTLNKPLEESWKSSFDIENNAHGESKEDSKSIPASGNFSIKAPETKPAKKVGAKLEPKKREISKGEFNYLHAQFLNEKLANNPKIINIKTNKKISKTVKLNTIRKAIQSKTTSVRSRPIITVIDSNQPSTTENSKSENPHMVVNIGAEPKEISSNEHYRTTAPEGYLTNPQTIWYTNKIDEAKSAISSQHGNSEAENDHLPQRSLLQSITRPNISLKKTSK